MKKIYFIFLLLTINSCKKSDNGTVEVIPLAPTDLKAENISKDQINLNWKDNSTNETGYTIERKTDSGTFNEIGSTNTDLTTFSDKTVSINTNYTYRVYSFNKVGKSIQYSNEVSIKTINIPTISTSGITNITWNSAKSGGNISSDGGSPIISKGVVWDINSNPTITLNTKTSDGTGTGTFQSNIIGLNLGTKFYIRSYATNNAGTAYGNEVTFTTINTPTLTTNAITNITSSSAITGGNISSDGGASIITRGVVWGTTNNPTISLSTKTTNGSGQGVFQSAITELDESSKYFVRAYATNSAGTAYGNEISFTTAKGFVFGTVVGANGRIWMDRNLGASRVATSSTDAEAYGDLYQWGRAADGHEKRTSKDTIVLSNTDQPGHSLFIKTQYSDWRKTNNNNLWQGVNGINNPCPKGFRLPTEAEWIAEKSSWGSGTASEAFASPLKLPVGGVRINDSLNGGTRINGSGLGGLYWSSSTYSGAPVQARGFSIWKVSQFYYEPRATGASVRCIKD